MGTPPVTGVELVALDERRHLQPTWTWITDPTLRTALGTKSEPTLAEHRAWFDRQLTDVTRWTRVIELGGAPVGVCGLHSIDRDSLVGEVWLHCSSRIRRGIGREALRLLLVDAFGSLGLHRVRARVFAFNAAARGFFPACGFVPEGAEREAVLIDGTFHDVHIFGLLDRELAR